MHLPRATQLGLSSSVCTEDAANQCSPPMAAEVLMLLKAIMVVIIMGTRAGASISCQALCARGGGGARRARAAATANLYACILV
jgi:hypothetical protein